MDQTLIRLLVVLAASLCVVLPQQAYSDEEYFNNRQKPAFYKWVDQQGITHYSEHPPSTSETKERQVETILIEKTRSAPTESPAPTTVSPTVQLARPDAAANTGNTSPSAPASDDAITVANCKKATANLTLLQQNQRLREQQPNGDMVYLTDEEKQKRVDSMQSYVNGNCQ